MSLYNEMETVDLLEISDIVRKKNELDMLNENVLLKVGRLPHALHFLLIQEQASIWTEIGLHEKSDLDLSQIEIV